MTDGATNAGTIYLGDLDTWTFTATQGDYIALSMGAVAAVSAHFAPWIQIGRAPGVGRGGGAAGAGAADGAGRALNRCPCTAARPRVTASRGAIDGGGRC